MHWVPARESGHVRFGWKADADVDSPPERAQLLTVEGRMASLFLSYSHEDEECAKAVARVLESAGHSVWWDRHITSGREFSPEIEAALAKADLVLVAWSKHSTKSPWVRDEAAIGRDAGRLFPILIDGSQPPIGFRQFQSFNLSRWKRRTGDPRTVELVEAIQARLTGEARPTPRPKHNLGSSLDRRAWLAVAVVALLLAAVAASFILRPGRAESEPASLAVLPFKNLSSGDPYFAEGIAEEISSHLSREPQFKVAGRTSSALFKDAADLREVGRRLQVGYVLEGSVRSAGDQVRVDVSLVDTRRGMRLWSQNFRGSLNDIFAIQDNVAKQVAARLKRQLVRTAIQGATTTRGDVYSLYVTARSLIRTREPAKLATAVELLNRAVRLDPNYAPAWARLAQAKYMSRAYSAGGNALNNKVRQDELADAQRAIALAPELAEARAVMWLLLDGPNSSEQMKRRARAEIERAVQLNATDAQNWYWLSLARQRDDLDFEGAMVAGRKAVEIDPFFVFNQFYTELAWGMGDRKSAIRLLRHWSENHPDSDKRERALETIALYNNDWSEVYRHLKNRIELTPDDMRPALEAGMGQILRRLGLTDRAKLYLEPDFIAMWQGKAPPYAELLKQEPLDFWTRPDVPLVARGLINNQRAADLVSLYDRAFPSRDSMENRLNKPQFVELAPIAASALRDVGRIDEAARLVTVADRLCVRAMRKGRTPINFQVDCAHSWAMLGRGDDTLRALERALKAGWRPEGGWSYQLTDEPVYRSISDDPRLKRLGQLVLAENTRERRELVAAGL